MAGEKLIREAIEAARAAMARGALPPAENSRLTQIATTGPSYDKALRHLERAGIETVNLICDARWEDQRAAQEEKAKEGKG
jgi:hypothetical protein